MEQCARVCNVEERQVAICRGGRPSSILQLRGFQPGNALRDGILLQANGERFDHRPDVRILIDRVHRGLDRSGSH